MWQEEGTNGSALDVLRVEHDALGAPLHGVRDKAHKVAIVFVLGSHAGCKRRLRAVAARAKMVRGGRIGVEVVLDNAGEQQPRWPEELGVGVAVRSAGVPATVLMQF